MPARPATKVRKQRAKPKTSTPKPPSERSQRAAALLSERILNRPLRVRLSFIRNEDGVVSGIPPLASLLRGGRGGEVRLKLLLSLLWAAGGGDPRHQTHYPARSWAALLDLPDPEGNGQRRVRDALQWLEERKFIKTDLQPGKPTVIHLLREDGSGRAYTDPADAYKKVTGSDKKAITEKRRRELHLTVPDTFWTDGWIAMLSARAVAMLLVIGEVTFSDREWDWVSPRIARRRYGISEDTWSRGIKELYAQQIIEIRRRPVSLDDFDFRRVRNTYRVGRDNSRRIILPAPPTP
jgi:hypothetical protein